MTLDKLRKELNRRANEEEARRAHSAEEERRADEEKRQRRLEEEIRLKPVVEWLDLLEVLFWECAKDLSKLTYLKISHANGLISDPMVRLEGPSRSFMPVLHVRYKTSGWDKNTIELEAVLPEALDFRGTYGHYDHTNLLDETFVRVRKTLPLVDTLDLPTARGWLESCFEEYGLALIDHGKKSGQWLRLHGAT